MRLVHSLSAAIAALIVTTVAAVAQGQFSPVITVDNAVITQYELDQRARFLGIVGAAGDRAALAREQLIEDRLKLAAAQRAGINLTEEGLENGVAEFAGRANLTVAEFEQVLAGNGVSRETLEDFVRSGLTWREVVRQRFGSRAQISEAEIDRAMGATSAGGGVRVLLNEIILPARPIRGEAAQAQRQAERLQQITSISAFQAQARQISVGPSRARSGRLDWLTLSELPAPLRPILLNLRPGQVSEPISVPNALILFQMREIEEIAAARPAPAAIDYAALYLPGGRSERTLSQAARIAARADTCDDLYGEARKMPREALERGSKTPAEIPQDVAIELAKLDPGETSTALTRANGETLVLLMMCSRIANLDGDASRDGVREQLRQQRLSGFADGYLAQLRADAVIRGN